MSERLASIDLGSNTFRLSIGRVVRQGGCAQVYTEDHLRELVAMAEGLDEHQRLRPAAIEQALATLRRFGERLRGFPPANVRCVATNTFRVARNAADILPAAERALGFPIEIISGLEEARLIYLGVMQDLPPTDHHRLVIDIGGGSTEFIIGRGKTPLQLASLELGCTTLTRRFFPQGRITEARMQQAILAARVAIVGIASRYRQAGWQEAYGSSGTAKGLMAILRGNGLSQTGITASGMQQLRAGLVRRGQVRLEDWVGLKPERVPVLPGGLAIMIAAFHELGIDTMQTGEGALRTGVLQDLLGRDQHRDQRDETVRQFIRRYALDDGQAENVCRLALALFDQQPAAEDAIERLELRRALGWTARLHEVGLAISRHDYHKHAAYILEHADMPGFSHDDQKLLAFLALGHQGRLAKVRACKPDAARWLALLCLRLAVLFFRRRDAADVPAMTLQSAYPHVFLTLDARWLADRPLTRFQLAAETRIWHKVGITLEILEANAQSMPK
ncbi:exopolyphosphatase [Castellaniella sp.]|uniref:Ppx/GppA phosphatase family protein n=1 Tax=Castellaniella sp. TaxID=1955812 RepID=UPI003562E107